MLEHVQQLLNITQQECCVNKRYLVMLRIQTFVSVTGQLSLMVKLTQCTYLILLFYPVKTKYHWACVVSYCTYMYILYVHVLEIHSIRLNKT